jgi:hypothetical protein
MRLPETRDLFAQNLTFPVTCETVVETIGDAELEAPNGETETIDGVLDCSGREFDSADELYNELMTFVSESFIGRKFYDDRGSQPSGDDREEVSF